MLGSQVLNGEIDLVTDLVLISIRSDALKDNRGVIWTALRTFYESPPAVDVLNPDEIVDRIAYDISILMIDRMQCMQSQGCVQVIAFIAFGSAPAALEIRGKNFFVELNNDLSTSSGLAMDSRFSASLNDIPLGKIEWIDNQTLETTTPTDLPIGQYDFTLQTPAGQSTFLEDAIIVTESSTNTENAQGGDITMQGGRKIEEVMLEPVVDATRSILFFNYTHDGAEPGEIQ